MKCCIDCFHDNEIRTIIEKLDNIGDCDFCGSKKVKTYLLNEKTNIEDMINGVLDLYSVATDQHQGRLLWDILYDDWNIFAGSLHQIETLVRALCSDQRPLDDAIFTSKIFIPQTESKDFIEEFAVVSGLSWQNFSDIIRERNRFHSGLFNHKIFEDLLQHLVKIYPDNTSYRTRICSADKTFSIAEMGAPPKDKRSAGRINPEGIGVLYLASDVITTISEVRASIHDFVTVGEFKAKRELRVIDLLQIASISPFAYASGYAAYALNRKVFQEIALTISKPQRGSDSPLEYLPTQYISEFIKSKGYDGVEYASTVSESGHNLAIFDEDLFTCVGTTVYEVKGLSYNIEEQENKRMKERDG